jgi:hypothetical protein
MKQVHLVNYVPHNERARQAKCSEFSGILGLDFFRPKSDNVWRTGVTTNETPIRRQ